MSNSAAVGGPQTKESHPSHAYSAARDASQAVREPVNCSTSQDASAFEGRHTGWRRAFAPSMPFLLLVSGGAVGLWSSADWASWLFASAVAGYSLSGST